MAIPIQIHFRFSDYARAPMPLFASANFVSCPKIRRVPAFSLLRAGKIIAKAKVIQTAQ
jgi:hypothetical protein